jgi:hypothetical protein
MASVKDPDWRRRVWAKANETAPDGKLTEAHVAQVRDEIVPPEFRKPTKGNQ